jgi:hypothetical protein
MTRSSAGDLIDALERLSAIHVRNDVKRVFVDGDEARVIDDFVYDRLPSPSRTAPNAYPRRDSSSFACGAAGSGGGRPQRR